MYNAHPEKDFKSEKMNASLPSCLLYTIRHYFIFAPLLIIGLIFSVAAEGQNNTPVFSADKITAGSDFNQLRESESITAELKSFQAYSIPMESILGYINQMGRDEMTRFVLELPEFGSWELELWKSDPRVRSGFQTIVKKNGEITYLPKRETGTYRGKILGDSLGRVAASIREDHFSMHLQKESELIVLETPAEAYVKNGKLMVIAYLAEDLRERPELVCGGELHQGGETREWAPGRAAETIDSCRSVRIAIAADGAMVERLGSPEEVEDELMDLFNVVQMRYDHPEISIKYEIRTIFISATREDDPWYDEHPNSFGRLVNNFRKWGVNGGFQTTDFGVASIWSARSFQGNAVGLAISQPVGRQFGYNANQHYTYNSTRLIMVWAHELGHNWKAQHTSSANNKYIMSPRVGNLNDQWHTNSIEVISNYKSEIEFMLEDCDRDSVSIDVKASFENVDSCSYHTGGAIYLDVEGGSPPYFYEWSDGSQSRDLVDVEGGEYFVTITDDSGESLVMGYYIRFPEPIYVSATPFALCDRIDLTNIWVHDWGGGTGELELEWWDGSDRDFLFHLPPGEYPLKVTDEYGCQIKDTVVFNGYEPIELYLDVKPSECGRSNGQVITEIIGGDPTTEMSVAWSHQDETHDWDLLNVDSGKYMIHVRNLGCNIRDTVEVGLTPIKDTIQEKLCPGEIFKLGDEEFDTGGKFSKWFQTEGGCDSVVHLFLAEEVPIKLRQYELICSQETFDFFGEDLNSHGWYTHSIPREQKCDSIIHLYLQVTDPDATVLLEDGQLQGMSNKGEFQWYRCLDDRLEKIPGAVGTSFEPDQSGRYALVHQIGVCRDSSACVDLVLSSAPESILSKIVIWPNPHSNEFFVDLPGGSNLEILRLTNSLGKEVRAKVDRISPDRFRISHHSPPGILFLLVELDGEIAVRKLIHQHGPR